MNLKLVHKNQKIKGNTYAQRVKHQTDEWVNGNPIHNTVDNECCPDFSCCKPEFLQSKDVRKSFAKANKETQHTMLMGFLGSAISKAFPEKNIYITG